MTAFHIVIVDASSSNGVCQFDCCIPRYCSRVQLLEWEVVRIGVLRQVVVVVVSSVLMQRGY